MEVRGLESGETSVFRMPLHYPRYTMKDYQDMPEWKLDRLLSEYGLSTFGDLPHKRDFAMGAFLWPNCFQISMSPQNPKVHQDNSA
ncbi:PREDICTED: uncharacterized protein LOC109117095 [Tarenaya hassleriana]|uniref:uncharacterized protein LOC109117095 n=1 Tax=Tarenaya hassleriana TaxID=28532 RepID=UPI0008FD15DC|nr:PREDICTED: uncharacterized protein LOC109117095 [Tarenaya hassleriana]